MYLRMDSVQKRSVGTYRAWLWIECEEGYRLVNAPKAGLSMAANRAYNGMLTSGGRRQGG